MRLVFTALVLINILLFGWFYSQEPASRMPLVVNDPGTEKLVLVSERQKSASAVQPARPKPAAAVARKVELEPVTPAVRKPGKPAEPEKVSPVPDAGNMTAPGKADTRPKAATKAGKARPGNNAGPEPAPAKKPQAQPATTALCYRFGPFRSKQDSEGLHDQLRVLGFPGGRLKPVTTVRKRYWVLISPVRGRSRARNMVARMKKAGVTDLQILYSAGRYTISLGLFQRKEIAEKRVRDLNGLGFKPRIAIQERPNVRYWLEFDTPVQGDWLSSKWESLMSAWPDVRRETIKCPQADTNPPD